MSAVHPTDTDRFYEVYDRYVRPLEPTHAGQYVMVAPDGQMILATDLSDLVAQADQLPPTGNYLYKVGQVAAFTIL